MADPRGFGKRMKTIAKTVGVNADQLVRKVCLAVDSAVVLATPVDTGRARSNWQVDLNNAPAGTLPEPASPAEGVTRATAEAAEKAKAYKAGDTVHITNNLPYIGRLNEGWSAQAPAGFVEEAALAGATTVKDARLLVKADDRIIGGNIGPIG